MVDMWEALVGADVVTEHEVLHDHAVLVRDGLIEAVVPVGQVPSTAAVRDLGQGFLTPGLIDIHTHGADGHGFSEGNGAAYRGALGGLLHAGVTTALPTLVTAPLDSLEESLDVLSSLKDTAGLPRIPGAHLEGPYFSYAQRGAQDPAALRQPDDGSVDRLLERAAAIRMISFAPELPGAVEFTERLVDVGIVAAAGHTDGRDEDLYACQRAGLTHVIHIFSGQSTTVRSGPWRQPGMLEATLASNGLTVEMIADGHHLPATLMQLAYRCLAGRLLLVSDSTPGAGLPDGTRYRLGDQEYVIEGGVGMTLDRTAFAGSTTLVSSMLPVAISSLGIGIPEAIAMVTSIPATAARLDDVGRIAPGARADFALFDADLTVTGVALAGEWQPRSSR
jgi:N-acetylglucosamine-6-phosphate deacetylase